MTPQTMTLAEHLGERLSFRNLTVATAESCTGGGVGQAMTAISGSSQWFAGGVIAYSNTLKHNLLNVSSDCLLDYGAVSEQTAMGMVEGVLRIIPADLAVSTTGIAGPTGATQGKPLGTVCFAYGSTKVRYAQTFYFDGDRHSVREQSVNMAIKLLLQFIDDEQNTV